MNDRIPGTTYWNPIWYREKWRIYLTGVDLDDFQYTYIHDDYDGPGDKRHGHAESVEAAKAEVDAIEDH